MQQILPMLVVSIGLGAAVDAAHMEIAGLPTAGDGETQRVFHQTVEKLEHGRGVQAFSSSDVSAEPRDAPTPDAAVNEGRWMDVDVGVYEQSMAHGAGSSQHAEPYATQGGATRAVTSKLEEAAEQSTNLEIRTGQWWQHKALIIPAITSVIALVAGVVYSMLLLMLRTADSTHTANSSYAPWPRQRSPKVTAAASKTPACLGAAQPLPTLVEGFIATAKSDGGSGVVKSGTLKSQVLQQAAVASRLAASSSAVSQSAQKTPSESLLPTSFNLIRAQRGYSNALNKSTVATTQAVSVSIVFHARLIWTVINAFESICRYANWSVQPRASLLHECYSTVLAASTAEIRDRLPMAAAPFRKTHA
jgi:hypothetical protein